MCMHVPETRQQRFAGSVDDLSVCRRRLGGFWSDRCDAIAMHYHALAGNDLRRLGVEVVYIFYDYAALRHMAQCSSEFDSASILHLLLCLMQSRDNGLKSLPCRATPAVSGR